MKSGSDTYYLGNCCNLVILQSPNLQDKYVSHPPFKILEQIN